MLPSTIHAQSKIFLLNVEPEQAQQLISTQKINLDYASKIAEHPAPVYKTATGETFYQGRFLDNPSDYVEEEYLAKHHHGQDGLGRYLFSYEDWNQARMEAKNGNGEVRGQYKYKNEDENEVVVNYWADSLGFHHEDNLPKTILEPVTDEPMVQAAKEEHMRAWRRAAEAAKVKADPKSDEYNRLANQYDEHQAQLDQANEIYRNAAQANVMRMEPKVYWEPKQQDLGEPRGFFYSFDYPVQVLRNIQQRDRLRKTKRESTRTAQSQHFKSDDPKVKVLQGDDVALLRASAVHDVQVPKHH